jgi:CRP/FNR family cyclic AMP-dependent transcriptional regulator
MTSESLLRALRSMDFTRDLDPKHLETLASIATQVTFSEGASLFREGDVSELVYLVEEGEVALETQVPGHGQVVIHIVGPGQLLGWSSLFPPERKTAGARAMKPTKAIAINATKMRELCQQDHDLGCRLIWRVAEVISNRLRVARAQLLDIFEPGRKNK